MLDLAVNTSQLSLGLAPSRERAMLGDILDIDTIVLEETLGLHVPVLLSGPLGEAKVLGHEDLLTSGELELGSSQSLNDVVLKALDKLNILNGTNTFEQRKMLMFDQRINRKLK